jgi:hypothetical protein
VRYGGGDPPTRLEASLNAGLELIVDAEGMLTPDLVTLVVDIPANPALAEIVNRGLVPELIRLIEQTFLRPIRIPPLGLGALQVAPPVVATGEGQLLASTALLPTQPEAAPLAGAWPERTVFAAVDAKVVNALLDQEAEGKSFTGKWRNTFWVGPFPVTLVADYSGTLSQIDVDFVPGQQAQLGGTATIDATATIKIEGLPWLHPTAKATATPTVHVTTSVNAANEVIVKLDNIDEITFDIDIIGLPGFLDNLIEKIVNALGSNIADAVEKEIAKLPPFAVTRIPEIPIVLDDTTVVLTLKDVTLSTITTPDGKTCLAATGGAAVRVDPPAVKHNLVRADG